MQTELHNAHDAHDATGDTCDSAMLQCKLTILPDVYNEIHSVPLKFNY